VPLIIAFSTSKSSNAIYLEYSVNISCNGLFSLLKLKEPLEESRTVAPFGFSIVKTVPSLNVILKPLQVFAFESLSERAYLKFHLSLIIFLCDVGILTIELLILFFILN